MNSRDQLFLYEIIVKYVVITVHHFQPSSTNLDDKSSS